MNARIIPNLLTIGRIVAVPPLIWLLLNGHHGWALALAVAAGVSDLLDGWLARRFDWQSRFGSFADPAADKLLMVGCYLTLGWLGELVWWVVTLVILRDVVIVIGAFVYHRLFAPVEAQPTQLSRFNTFCQIFLMWFVLIRLAGFPMPEQAQIGLEWLVAFMAVVTLTQYVWLWSVKAARTGRKGKGSAGAR